ncbi:MAG TPA: FtsX-like permease family protein, partial [Candidatus Solibacter sp.]|nr:FtsX-like permease family protein [Candidatus Solibacter sp.]
TESLLLSLTGGGLGLLLGNWTLGFLVNIAPRTIPRLAEISLDARVAGFGLLAAIVTGIAAGLAPAMRLSRLAAGLHRSGNRVTLRSTGRRALVLLQVAIAVVLTAGAALLTQSLQHLIAIDNGFAADHLIGADLYWRGVNADSREIVQHLLAEASAVPGVKSVAVSGVLPTHVIWLRTSVGRAGSADVAQKAVWRPVSAGYFDTAGIPILAGRPLNSSDSQLSSPIAIVNRTFVRVVLGGGSALDTRLATSFKKEPLTIVGVVGDITPAGEPDLPSIYVPAEPGGGNLLVRTAGDPRAVLPVLTARLHAAAPEIAMDRVHRLAETLEAGRAVTRFTTLLVATFAGIAFLLSMIGVYGLVASEVSARWRELAIRLTLGATQTETLWTVMRPCAFVVGGGGATGVLGALGVGPALGSLLQGVASSDVLTLAIAPALLGVVGMLAAIVAAARVLRADPATTLRCD